VLLLLSISDDLVKFSQVLVISSVLNLVNSSAFVFIISSLLLFKISEVIFDVISFFGTSSFILFSVSVLKNHNALLYSGELIQYLFHNCVLICSVVYHFSYNLFNEARFLSSVIFV